MRSRIAGTGKLPWVTWQKLKADKVPFEQWPEYAKRSYLRMNQGAVVRKDASTKPNTGHIPRGDLRA
jgi:hypothetical protein